MTLLVYLKNQLNFKGQEWLSLSTEDKNWYKDAARSEMNLLGIEITETPVKI